MKKLFQEFKDFAFSGDIINLAVAFVMAGAFGVLIAAAVENLVMPIVGIIFGQPSFDGLYWEINDSIILYGRFLTVLVTFVAVALGVFFRIVKPYKAYQARIASGEEEAPAAPPADIALLTEIRDALQK